MTKVYICFLSGLMSTFWKKKFGQHMLSSVLPKFSFILKIPPKNRPNHCMSKWPGGFLDFMVSVIIFARKAAQLMAVTLEKPSGAQLLWSFQNSTLKMIENHDFRLCLASQPKSFIFFISSNFCFIPVGLFKLNSKVPLYSKALATSLQ